MRHLDDIVHTHTRSSLCSCVLKYCGNSLASLPFQLQETQKLKKLQLKLFDVSCATKQLKLKLKDCSVQGNTNCACCCWCSSLSPLPLRALSHSVVMSLLSVFFACLLVRLDQNVLSPPCLHELLLGKAHC